MPIGIVLAEGAPVRSDEENVKMTMTKRTETCFLILCLTVATLFSAVRASAAEETIGVAALMTVRGTVRFEKRSTVVPMINDLLADALSATLPFCDGGNCPRSNPYWAVTVNDGKRLYELHQPFAIGSLRAPSFVEINGVILRPGAEITVEGSIESLSETYGIISDVKSISVLSSPGLPGLEMVGSIYGAESSGWNCQSTEDPNNGVDAWIWYGRETRRSRESFHLRVVIKRLINIGRIQQGVTDISNVQMSQVAGNIVYQGSVDDTAATLAIQRNSPQIRNYPSRLAISSMQGALGARMLCSPVSSASMSTY